MKRNVQITVCRVAVIVLLAGAAVTGARAQAAPEAEFKKLAAAFSEAWAKGDAKGIAALHTKDAVRLSGGGDPASVGTAAIEQAMTAALTGPYKGTTLTINPNASHRVDDHSYIGEGTYEVVGGTPPPGVPTRGQYMNTMVRQGGRWLIAASAIMPALAPPK